MIANRARSCAGGAACWRGACRPGCGAERAVHSASGLPHRPLRAERHPVRQRHADYYKLINARDGGINGVKITVRGVRDRLRHRPRRRMLRAPEGQGPDRRGLVDPALHRHHLRAHREGAGRQDPDHLDGLRPLRSARRRRLPLDLPAARHLLDGGRHRSSSTSPSGRRHGQAQGQEDRARLSRLALRQGADPDAAEARAEARLRIPCSTR